MNLPALREYLKAHPVTACRNSFGCPFATGIPESVEQAEEITPQIKQLVMAAVADSHLDWTPELREIMDA